MNKFKTFLFETKVILLVLFIPLLPTVLFVGCAIFDRVPEHYYKIQRLDNYGQVQQVYYSTGYPCGTDNYVTFKQYPSGATVMMHCPYIAEDIGTNKPSF